MLIFIPSVQVRHQYVFSHIMDRLGISFEITDNEESFKSCLGEKMSYGKEHICDELFFEAEGLLDELELRAKKPDFIKIDDVPVLFSIKNSKADLPFDIFSAVFYLLVRYEEYLLYEADTHGRFEAKNSIAAKFNLLQLPIVDLWIQQLAIVLQKKYPALKIKSNAFTFQPSYDIDIAFSYKYKGCIRNAGGFTKSMLHGKFSDAAERIKVLLGLTCDPYDSYELLDRLADKSNTEPLYFVHPGTYGIYDKNISLAKKKYTDVLKTLTHKGIVGLHPSYKSVDEPSLLIKEKEALENAVDKSITKVRQHFIRLRFPETYRNFLNAGFTEDYSMGYATENGFRAGTAYPFYFYDLLKNQQTSLLIHPFVIMDGVYATYKNSTPKNILNEYRKIIQCLQQSGGTFTSVWHNHTLGSGRDALVWKNLYLKLFEELAGNQ